MKGSSVTRILPKVVYTTWPLCSTLRGGPEGAGRFRPLKLSSRPSERPFTLIGGARAGPMVEEGHYAKSEIYGCRRSRNHRLRPGGWSRHRSEEHTSELQALMRISYAVFCLKNKNRQITILTEN